MKSKHNRRVMAGALMVTGLGLCVGQAMAKEISGTLDGEANEWHVLSHSEGSTASFSEIAPGMLNVTVQGHREDRYETQGTLSIDFMVMQGSPSQASVTYFHESGLTPHYGTKEEVPIEIETLEIGDGDTGRVTGRVATSLAYVESMTVGHDQDNTLDIDVNFDVTLTRQE
ncbi:MAG TPA: hypothetical protein VLO12_01015 [Halomonas sp.]|nr:hypothetical protein [Halomonas sp.]